MIVRPMEYIKWMWLLGSLVNFQEEVFECLCTLQLALQAFSLILFLALLFKGRLLLVQSLKLILQSRNSGGRCFMLLFRSWSLLVNLIVVLLIAIFVLIIFARIDQLVRLKLLVMPVAVVPPSPLDVMLLVTMSVLSLDGLDYGARGILSLAWGVKQCAND